MYIIIVVVVLFVARLLLKDPKNNTNKVTAPTDYQAVWEKKNTRQRKKGLCPITSSMTASLFCIDPYVSIAVSK